ncbi:Wzz/FepE/Etk N-terminal domain-containing protein [sulfur-oxidizing endosymbiont of Gigantopelta aegis]|uniref:Wzz/FepE/Etk N-terminal domain-containing protein n=1 Tax=sulfur-oxidizing endosymbiont of Gigantopelta aegis TaxID=2794934 RepID=UPI0018DBF539|nr:Wzz/FepE/Etk N-terminal domain-containing protein [sulfur-oxidizing endosymbiont of Gigantopelta aegis]
MTDKNTPPQQVLVYPQYPIQDENEINLYDLWQALVKQKKAILSTIAIVTLLALLYALFTTPIYKAEIIFLPPANNDIQSLNIEGVSSVKAETVYAMFRENLGSISIRKQLFEQMNLVDHFEPNRNKDTNVNEIFNQFNEYFKLTIPNPKKGGYSLPTSIFSLEGRDPVLIADILNSFATQAELTTKTELIADINARLVEQKKQLKLEMNLLLEKTKKQRLDEAVRLETADSLGRKKIEDQIKSLRELAKKQRLDEIDRLETANLLERKKLTDRINTLKGSAKGKRLDRIKKLVEASEIAHSMGLKEPIAYKLKKISKSANIKSQIMTDISSNTPQLYTRGYEALEAEIVSLTKRTNDNPFIKELRGLEEKLKLLKYNRKVEQLKNRTNDDPFITELRGLEKKLALLKHNRKAEQL